jgi:hypothetical protein
MYVVTMVYVCGDHGMHVVMFLRPDLRVCQYGKENTPLGVTVMGHADHGTWQCTS